MKKNRKVKLTINTEWCKGCGICTELCPKQVLELDKHEKSTVLQIKNCIGCQLCELRCPDLAIEVETEQDES